MSMHALDRMIPVSPPSVNKKMNPRSHSPGVDGLAILPTDPEIHLKILIPVGMAMIIVADVK